MDRAENTNSICRSFPKYSILPICLYLLVYNFIYFGATFIITHFNIKISYFTTSIDNYIPYISLFVIPYCIYYIYIILSPILIARCNEYFFYRFILAAIIGSLIGGITFLIKPSCAVKDLALNQGFFDNILLFLRQYDKNVACCPSFHCFLSALICIAISSVQNIKNELKIRFYIVSGFIILSTLFTKQHVIIDCIVGILLSVISWNLAKNERYIDILKRLFKKN